MALQNLRTDLNATADAGGIWTYTGPTSITVDITGQVNPITLNNGNTVPGGDDPELEFCSIMGLAVGAYPTAFTYTIAATGGCPAATANVGLTIQASPDAGTSQIINLCSNDTAVNIFNSLGGTPANTGVWSGTGLADGGYNANGAPVTDDTFDPALSTVGAKTFTYTVAGLTGSACDCPDSVATLTINVTAPFDAGTGGNATICI